MIHISELGALDWRQQSLPAWKIDHCTLELTGMFVDQPESREIVAEISAKGSRCRPKQIVNLKQRDNVIIDLQQ
jgi:hypothetical protein